MLAESEIESMNTANVASPTRHGEVLAARKARVDAGEGSFLTIEELRSRLY